MPVNMPSAESQPYLEVVAPATLPEGYTFDAEANGQSFTVKVPMGGVEQGQKFSVPFPAGSDGYTGAAIPRASVPVGRWKDDMCACCRFGICHPVLWNAYCFPMVLMGQIMTRLKLTWLGNEGSVSQTASTFRILLWITIAFIVTRILQYFPLFFFTDEYGSLTNMGYVVYNTCTFLILSFCIFFIALTCKTRKHIRNKYNIPEQSCHGCEDCCCAYWCSCCTVAQMARHTGDYESYAGRCCSETGMPPHAPSIV